MNDTNKESSATETPVAEISVTEPSSSGRNIKKKNKLKKYKSVSELVESSISAGILTSCGRMDLKAKDSFFLSLVRTDNIRKKLLKPAKKTISKVQEESATNYLFRYVGRSFLTSSMSVIALIFLIFGLFNIVWSVLRPLIETRILDFGAIDKTNLIVSITTILLSIVVMLGGKGNNLATGICESRLVSFILFDLFGFNKEEIEEKMQKDFEAKEAISQPIAVLLGVILGMLTMFFRPLTVLTKILMLLFAIVVFKVPEAGVVMVFAVLPFTPVENIVLMTVYIWGCFFFKVLIGRRTFSMSFTDFCVLLFAIITLFAGGSAGTVAGWIGGALRCWYILLFLLISTTLKNREWITRTKCAICISSGLLALFSVTIFVVRLLLGYFKDSISQGIFTAVLEKLPPEVSTVSVFDDFTLVGTYIMMTVFFFFFGSREKKAGSVLKTAIIIVFCIVVMAVCGSWTVWLGFLVGFAVYLCYRNKNSIYYIILSSISAIVALLLVPSHFMNTFVEFCNFTVPDLYARVKVFAASLRMALDNFLGIGSSPSSFAELYQIYDKTGGDVAKHSGSLFIQTAIETGIASFVLFVFIILLVLGSYLLWSKTKLLGDNRPVKAGYAGICSVAAILGQGILDYVLYNPTVCIMFFMVLGFTYANCKLMRSEANDEEQPVEHVYYFENKQDEGEVK